MKTPNKEQLLTDLRLLGNSESRLHCALNDVLNDKVKWFKKGVQRIGVSRPASACGGIVIHQYKGNQDAYACVYQWEQWYADVRGNHSQDKEVRDLRECAYDANLYMTQEIGRVAAYICFLRSQRFAQSGSATRATP
jgi:hypothetical protein